MKKLKKIFFWVALVTSVLLLASILFIKIVFPPEKVKQIFTNQIAEYLNRQIIIEKVNVGLFKGIRVEGLKVSQRPTFEKGSFVEVKEVIIKYQLLPLLNKILVVNKIALVNPKIAIEYLPDGNFNFTDLMEQKSDEKKDPVKKKKNADTTKKQFSFLVSKIEILEGNVSFKDYYKNKFDTNLRDINLVIKNINPITPLWMDLSFFVETKLDGKKLEGKVELISKINLSSLAMDKMVIDIDKLSFANDYIESNISGQIKNIKEPAFNLDFLVKLNSIEKIKNILNISFPEKLVLKGASAVNGKAQGTASDIFVDGNLDLTNLGMIYGDMFAKNDTISSSIKLKATFKETKQKEKQLKIDSLEILLANLKLESKGIINDFNKPQIDFNLKANELSIKDAVSFSKIASGYGLQGTTGFNASLKGGLDKFKINGKLNLNNFQAEYEKTKITNLNTEIDFADNYVKVLKFNAKINDADFKIDKLLVNDFKKPQIMFNGSLSELDLGKVFVFPVPGQISAQGQTAEAKKKQKKVSSGSGTVGQPFQIKTEGSFKIGKIIYPNYLGNDGEAKWNFANVSAEPKELNGNILVNMGKGRISNLSDFMSKMDNKIAKALFYPVIQIKKLQKKGFLKTLGSSWNEINYDKIEGDYIFRNGSMVINNFHMYSSQTDIFSKGNVNLIKELIDLEISLKLPKGEGKDLAQFNDVDTEGRVILTFYVKGSMDDPQIRPKLKKAKEVIKEKGKELIKEKTKELLKKEETKKFLNKIGIEQKEGEEKEPEKIIEEKAKEVWDNLWKRK